MPTRVIGLGQPAAGDDGAGPAVVEALREHELPADVLLVQAADATAILPHLEEAERVILVDAVVGGTPGEIVTLSPAEWRASGLRCVSTHGIDLTQALALAGIGTSRNLCQEIVIFGICIARPEPFTIGLSPDIAIATTRAADLIRGLLWPDLA